MQLNFVFSKLLPCLSIVVFGILFGVSNAIAQTPPEILSIYKEFRTATEAGDRPLARDKAFEAWQAAEKILGDHKTTGDLANNYAYASGFETGLKLYKKRERAIDRSIKLAKFHEKDAGIREIERRLYLISHRNNLRNFSRGQKVAAHNKAVFRNTEKALDKHGLRGTTFEADLEVLKSQYYGYNRASEKAVSHANRALELYANKTDGYSSIYRYLARIYKGDVLRAQGDKVSAVLEYQTVMQSLKDSFSPDHPIVEKPFQKWLSTRYEVEEAGLMAEAEALGLCECWPFENYKSKPLPLIRVPPVMPRAADRSGSVIVKFDLDDKGKPTNITKVSSSKALFDKPALKSVEKWVYREMTPDQKIEDRKNITTVIGFRLNNGKGEIIPE